jgi:pilus assembly protein FimV
LQQQAQAAKPAPAPVPAPVPAAKKPEPTPAPVEAPKVAEKPAEVAPAPVPPKPEEVVAPKPAEVAPPTPVEPPKPAPEPVKKVQPVPPPEEPSFVDDNAMLVYGGGGLLALLLGYLGYSSMRRRRAGDVAPTTSRITEGDLMANSVFGSTGGQAVDTGASIQTDFSQSNLTSIDADEGVDPVAEADVYMAYGRDAQAEEILIDALKNDPTRHAIHLKLLEIYSSRKSVKQFESLATDLYGQTSGTGPDWDKAAEMGRVLDPDNPLYGGKPAEAGQTAAPAQEVPNLVVPPSEVEKLRETVTMPGQLGVMAATATAAAAELEPPVAMDFDLDLGAAHETTTNVEAEKEATPLDLNLEIGLPAVEGVPMDATVPMGMRMSEPAPASESSGLDFEFDLDSAAVPHLADSAIDIGTDIGTDVGTHAAPKMDLSSIDLDLGGPGAPDVAGSDQDDPDVTTKIELAQAYEEMGDKEGARELLQEVVQEGSSHQKEIARNKLALLEA